MIESIILSNIHFSEFATFQIFIACIAVDFNIVCIYYSGLVMRIKSNLLEQAS